MKVLDVMTHGVVAVRPDSPLKEAVRLLERHAISGLPVVDADGAVVGMLSETDLLLKEVGQTNLMRRRFGWLLGESNEEQVLRSRAEAVTVADAMTRPAIVVAPDVPVPVAARMMVERHVNRLPVVDGGQLVGIISRADIARVFLRPDEEIEAAIRREITRCTLGALSGPFRVRVTEGVADVGGTVDRRSTADVLEAMIRRVEGVVAVRTDITWTFDDLHEVAPDRESASVPWWPVR